MNENIDDIILKIRTFFSQNDFSSIEKEVRRIWNKLHEEKSDILHQIELIKERIDGIEELKKEIEPKCPYLQKQGLYKGYCALDDQRKCNVIDFETCITYERHIQELKDQGLIK